MDRRAFLGWVGVGFLASSLPVAIAACAHGGPNPTVKNSPNPGAQLPSVGAGEFQSVGNLSDLQQKGQLLDQQVASSPVLVVIDPSNPKAVVAVNPTCTHKGCTIEWKSKEKAFVCPCHDAKYDAKGKVLRGPAKQELKTYEAKLEGDKVLVKRG